MTPTEITQAARLIRPILARELSLCRAVYPPTHPDADQTGRIEQALREFDRLVVVAQRISDSEQQDASIESATN